MYVFFEVALPDGTFQKPFSVEVKRVYFHGMLPDNKVLWDVIHMDGVHERIVIQCPPYGDFTLGESAERIVGIHIVEFPTGGAMLSKDEFHARVGKGKFLHPQRGHYVEASELPEGGQ